MRNFITNTIGWFIIACAVLYVGSCTFKGVSSAYESTK